MIHPAEIQRALDPLFLQLFGKPLDDPTAARIARELSTRGALDLFVLMAQHRVSRGGDLAPAVFIHIARDARQTSSRAVTDLRMPQQWETVQ